MRINKRERGSAGIFFLLFLIISLPVAGYIYRTNFYHDPNSSLIAKLETATKEFEQEEKLRKNKPEVKNNTVAVEENPGVMSSGAKNFHEDLASLHKNFGQKEQGLNLNIKTWKTSKGIPVYYASSSELPIFDLAILVNAGSAQVPKQPGLAELTAEMLKSGTKYYSESELQDFFAEVGANFSIDTERDFVALKLRALTLDKFLNQAIDTLVESIVNNNFSTANLQKIRERLIHQIKFNDQAPKEVAERAFYSALYQEHPYAYPIYGNQNALDKITREDVLSFYNKFYVAENTKIVIIGSVDENTAKGIAEKITSKMPHGAKADPVPDPEILAHSVKRAINFPSTQTHILLGTLGFKWGDPDYFPLYLGNKVFGALPLVSELFREVRVKRGWAYHASSKFYPMKQPGPFIVEIQSRNSVADQAVNLATELLQDFTKQGPSEQDLNIAKLNVIGGFPILSASNEARLSLMCLLAYYELPLDFFDNYLTEINKVTREQIVAAFAKKIDENKFVTVTVGNSGAKKELNSKMTPTNPSNNNQNVNPEIKTRKVKIE